MDVCVDDGLIPRMSQPFKGNIFDYRDIKVGDVLVHRLSAEAALDLYTLGYHGLDVLVEVLYVSTFSVRAAVIGTDYIVSDDVMWFRTVSAIEALGRSMEG